MTSSHPRRTVLKAISVGAPLAGLGGVAVTTGTPEASAGDVLDPARRLAQALSENADVVARAVDGLGPLEADRALFFLLSAYDIATEMWFQKGDPTAPVLTNWELPWRKYGGDNPTTIYLSAPVSPNYRYRLRGPIGDAVYAGLQIYTKKAGFNEPSANISDTRLLRGGEIDLLIGGADPGDGTPWIPLVADDYLVMVRLYHRQVPGVVPPPISLSCLDAPPGAGPSLVQRADESESFFRECVLSTMSVTQVLREAGVNGYPPPDAPVHQPKYTGALFPTLDNAYDGFYVSLQPGQALRLRGQLPVARFCSFVFYDRWFNTPDIPAHRCFLTGEDVHLESDGSYEMILGPRNPYHKNWIDTAGLTEGIFAIRCLLPQRRDLPTAEVINVS